MHFTITGEYITQKVRDMVLSENIFGAVQILESMSIPENIIEQILLGSATLTGENENITLNEDTDTEYQKRLKEVYATVLIKQTTAYKVVAKCNILSGDQFFYRFSLLFRETNSEDVVVVNKENENKVLIVDLYPQGASKILKAIVGDKDYKDINISFIEERGLNSVDYELLKNREIELDKYTVNLFHSRNLDTTDYEEEYQAQYIDVVNTFNRLFQEEQDLMIKNLREEILEKSKESIVIDSYKIPKEPFIQWLLTSHIGEGYMRKVIKERFGVESVEWEPVSPSGLKLRNDNRSHTDWIIGAGLNPEDYYRSDLENLVSEYLTLRENDIVTFSGTGIISGRLTTDTENCKGKILFIPHAGVEFLDAARQAKAVVCKIANGGAHLVVNAEEEDINICMAYKVYDRLSEEYEDSLIELDFEKNKIRY